MTRSGAFEVYACEAVIVCGRVAEGFFLRQMFVDDVVFDVNVSVNVRSVRLLDEQRVDMGKAPGHDPDDVSVISRRLEDSVRVQVKTELAYVVDACLVGIGETGERVQQVSRLERALIVSVGYESDFERHTGSEYGVGGRKSCGQPAQLDVLVHDNIPRFMLGVASVARAARYVHAQPFGHDQSVIAAVGRGDQEVD
jgi:hypothetical protein